MFGSLERCGQILARFDLVLADRADTSVARPVRNHGQEEEGEPGTYAEGTPLGPVAAVRTHTDASGTQVVDGPFAEPENEKHDGRPLV